MAISSTRSAHAGDSVPNLLPYFHDAPAGVNLVQPAVTAVVADQRRRLLLVRVQPLLDHFLAIVRPLHELAAVVIANPFHLRRAVVEIINLAAYLAGPPAGQAPHEQRVADDHVNHERLLEALPLQQLTQILRLG